MEAIYSTSPPQSTLQKPQQQGGNLQQLGNSNKDQTGASNTQMTQMEMDEMLARELSNSFSSYEPPRRQRQQIEGIY